MSPPSALLFLIAFTLLCPLISASADAKPDPAQWELKAKGQGKNSASNVEVLKELGVEIKPEGKKCKPCANY